MINVRFRLATTSSIRIPHHFSVWGSDYVASRMKSLWMTPKHMAASRGRFLLEEKLHPIDYFNYCAYAAYDLSHYPSSNAT